VPAKKRKKESFTGREGKGGAKSTNTSLLNPEERKKRVPPKKRKPETIFIPLPYSSQTKGERPGFSSSPSLKKALNEEKKKFEKGEGRSAPYCSFFFKRNGPETNPNEEKRRGRNWQAGPVPNQCGTRRKKKKGGGGGGSAPFRNAGRKGKGKKT